MGLINCPKCRKAISDRAISCPYCKFAFSKQNFVKCEECGTEYESDLSACPKCGCPKPSITKKRNHNTVAISVIFTVLIVVGILGFGVTQRLKEAAYYSDMETVSYAMLDGAAKAETAGNLIKSVWYNAIYEEQDSETDQYTMKNGKFVDDFNDALSRLFEDENFIDSISEIETNQSEVSDLMKQLKNPPKKYEEAYSVLKVYYDNYLKMTRTVISPTGSLNTFLEDFNTYDNDIVDSYEKMKLYLD